VLTAAIPSITSITRDTTRRDYRIDVVVQKRLASDNASDIDPLLTLIDEMIAELQNKRLPDYKAAICYEVSNDPVYAAQHLERLRQFTSVVSFIYRVTLS